MATAKAIDKVTKDLRIYFMVDKSGSMQGAIESAKRCLTKFLGGFPLDRTHVSVFNTYGSEVKIQSARSAAVQHAFSKHQAGGGTSYSSGVRALAQYKPKDTEDSAFVFVGDQGGEDGKALAQTIETSGLRPSAFFFLPFGQWQNAWRKTVQEAAAHLGIPCIVIEESLFDDPYAVTQTMTNLIATTPVGQVRPGYQAPRRESLIEKIMKTPLLERPLWAN